MRARWRSQLAATVAVILVAVAACSDDTESSTSGQGDLCGPDVPLVNWVTFGQGFVTTYCQGCHASTTLDRQGAPAHVTFDTEAETVAQAGLILAVAATDNSPTMPPNGGPSDADRERLQVWLTCFAE